MPTEIGCSSMATRQPATALVVIAASAGGVNALQTLLSHLPANLPAAVAIVLHRTPNVRSALVEILRRATPLNVRAAEEGEAIAEGTVYVAPPERHLVVTGHHTFHLTDGHRIRYVQSSANPLFETAAPVFGARLIAVVLMGFDSDATDGVQGVAAEGGTVIAQDPATAVIPDMPRSAIATGAVDYVLPLGEIAPRIVQLLRVHSPAANAWHEAS